MYNASIHLDENGVAHGHIDIIFHSSDNARGMKHQVSMGKALKQLGFVGTTKILPITEWENSERSILSEMCAEHDIEIVAGKKSKKHLSKEEYVLEREKEHTREMKAEIVSEIKSIETFLNETDDGNRFMLSEDNEELREELDYYKSKDNMENEKLVELWDNYKSENQEYWHRYHESKTAMKNEMSLMMKNKSCDNARLKKLFGEIFYGNDFIIIRLIKVLAALYLKRRIAYEEEKIKELQDINKQLKREAKTICNLSSDTAEALKSKDFEKINATFEKWEATLSSIDKCIENRFEIGKNSSLER